MGMAGPTGTPAAGTRPVGFGEALRYWVRLGFINFGGPAGQIAIMHRDLVEDRRWIGERDFLRALNFCMLLPGPEAQQLATYIGWLLHGLWGGVMAGVWFILPSVFVMLALSWLLAAHRDAPLMEGALYGVQPVVVAIVAEAVLRIGGRTLRHGSLVLLAAAAFVAIRFLGVPFPAIVALAGVLGWALARPLPRVFLPPAPTGDRPTGGGQASPAMPPLTYPLKVAAVCVGLWAVPVGLLALWQGWESVYLDVARFFTVAAFVTFGGAYAVLSYVAEAAVTVYRWLEPREMVNGLALAESTPGLPYHGHPVRGLHGRVALPGGTGPFLERDAGGPGHHLRHFPPQLPVHLRRGPVRGGAGGEPAPPGGTGGGDGSGGGRYPPPGPLLRHPRPL